MNARAAFAIAYRAVRLAHPHSGNIGRHVHPYNVRNLVYAAAGAVAGKRIPKPDDRLVIDYTEPLAYLQQIHRSVINARDQRASLAGGVPARGYDAKSAMGWIDSAIKSAWMKIAFFRHKRGNSDLWEIHLACRDDRSLLRAAWLETQAGVEGPARLAIRIMRERPTCGPEVARLAAEGLLAAAPTAGSP